MSKEFESAYLFTGVNGVGKSTLLKSICEKEPRTFHLFPGSTRLMERLGLEAGDYESLRRLPEDFKVREFDNLMIETLGQKSPGAKAVLLIDAHLYHYKQGEMIEGSTSWMTCLDSIFLVSTDATSLLKRISVDVKARDILPTGLTTDERLKMLTYFLDVTGKKAREISKQYGIPFFQIQNLDCGMQEALENFLNIWRKHMGFKD